MKCRVAQLVLCAHKKLSVMFDEGYYLNQILEYNSQYDNSLKKDVLSILETFPNNADDMTKLLLEYNEEITDAKQLKSFKLKLRALLEEIDFKRTREQLELSVTVGSGQAQRALRTVSKDKTYHLSPLLRCSIPRYSLSKFIQTVSGCDFLTPYNFRNKPTCRFCNNNSADWTHLFFNCENYKPGILDKIKNADLHPKTIAKITELTNNNDQKSLTDLLFCADGTDKFKSDISILCPIVAKTCVKIHQDWASQPKKNVLDEEKSGGILQ